jgi:hypothetical protein
MISMNITMIVLNKGVPLAIHNNTQPTIATASQLLCFGTQAWDSPSRYTTPHRGHTGILSDEN